jgi:hypothetical protein
VRGGAHEDPVELCVEAQAGRKCAHRKCIEMQRWSAPVETEKLVIDDVKGVVEIPIRQFVNLMLRMDRLLTRIDAILPDDESSIEGSTMSREEFISFTQEWLTGKGKRCAVFRFSGRWSHVNDRSEVEGSWATIDEAIDATSCDNDCQPKRFGSRKSM